MDENSVNPKKSASKTFYIDDLFFLKDGTPFEETKEYTDEEKYTPPEEKFRMKDFEARLVFVATDKNDNILNKQFKYRTYQKFLHKLILNFYPPNYLPELCYTVPKNASVLTEKMFRYFAVLWYLDHKKLITENQERKAHNQSPDYYDYYDYYDDYYDYYENKSFEEKLEYRIKMFNRLMDSFHILNSQEKALLKAAPIFGKFIKEKRAIAKLDREYDNLKEIIESSNPTCRSLHYHEAIKQIVMLQESLKQDMELEANVAQSVFNKKVFKIPSDTPKAKSFRKEYVKTIKKYRKIFKSNSLAPDINPDALAKSVCETKTLRNLIVRLLCINTPTKLRLKPLDTNLFVPHPQAVPPMFLMIPTWHTLHLQMILQMRMISPAWYLCQMQMMPLARYSYY